MSYYAVFVPPSCDHSATEAKDFLFTNIKDANQALKKYKGSRMKTYRSEAKALEYLENPDKEESFLDDSYLDLSASLDKLSLDQSFTNEETSSQANSFPSVQPRDLAQLRRKIEAGDHDFVESTIWSNPKHLVTICDSATYLMAGPKYNACHIAAKADKADIMALILDTVSNTNFVKLLYPDENDTSLQDRVSHLLDSYLNTPDPVMGNTPLHFASKRGHWRVVRVLLTFEGCDLMLKDSQGKTAEETAFDQKTKEMFKSRLDLPSYRDQLKKRLSISKLRYKSPSKSLADLDLDSSIELGDNASEKQVATDSGGGGGGGEEPGDSGGPPESAAAAAEVKMEGDKLE